MGGAPPPPPDFAPETSLADPETGSCQTAHGNRVAVSRILSGRPPVAVQVTRSSGSLPHPERAEHLCVLRREDHFTSRVAIGTTETGGLRSISPARRYS